MTYLEKLKAALPELVEVCPLCQGRGERKQVFTAGCGGGTYTQTAACDYCSWGHMLGLGYRMKDGSEVPISVMNQINVKMREVEKHDNLEQ